MTLVSFNLPWNHQATSGFLMYFRKYKKTPVPWNGLKIFLTNMSAECYVDIHACSIKKHAFLQLICTGSFDTHKRYKISMFSDSSWFQGTSLSDCSSLQPIETIRCFHYSMYFKGNQLEQTFFYYRIYFKLIKTVGLIYSLNESSFGGKFFR